MTQDHMESLVRGKGWGGGGGDVTPVLYIVKQGRIRLLKGPTLKRRVYFPSTAWLQYNQHTKELISVRELRSLLSNLCYVFRAKINSLVC